MQDCKQLRWISSLADPTQQRRKKPRKSGLTMVMDTGLGLGQFEDMLQSSAEYIDYIKLGFGTSALYPADILSKKINLAQKKQIKIYPGGTFFEVAYVQRKAEAYLEQLAAWGFDTVELSDGSTEISRKERNHWIKRANQAGLHVITECGKKALGSTLEVEQITSSLFEDLEYGASYMIVEGRESGENVGIYNRQGEMDRLFINQVLESCQQNEDYFIWEAPKKAQQVAFIEELSHQVNLGNISSSDIYSLEALRRGLRSDTFVQK